MPPYKQLSFVVLIIKHYLYYFTDRKNNGSDPNKWRTTGELWSYDYQLKEVGVLSTPVLTETLR